MARLYEGLMNGEELARAAALAREELRAHPQRTSPIGEIELRDWIVPVVFESAPVRVMERCAPVRLDLNILQDQQAKAGAEIGCPEPPVFGFVGRDDMTLELERAFQHETIVLLAGMAGIGKTEMAMGFARWCAETDALDGPIFFFRFEHYTPLARVLSSVGQMFNSMIRQRVGKDWHLCNLEQQRQVALAILRDVPCLMIWDNFEPVAGFPTRTESAWEPYEQNELRDFLHDLRGGKTKVLVTSRRDEKWLGEICRRVEVGGLKLSEAQELGVRVLRRAELNTEQMKALPQYNDLLKYLSGNPLAIQVILPELKRTTPDALLRALQTGEATLSADDPTQGRERSLTASLNYRLDTLDVTLRKHLGLLALFQGVVGASILAGICSQEDAPELILGMSRDNWIQILNTYDEVGLLRAVGKAYHSVHPVLPLFLHKIMQEAFPNQKEWFEQAFTRVYGLWSSQILEIFLSDTQRAMRLLAGEEQNLIQALTLAQRYQRLNDVALILGGINRLFTTEGRWIEWDRLVKHVEAEVTDDDYEPSSEREGLELTLLIYRAEVAHFQRDFDTEKALLLQQKDHFERVGNASALAGTLQNLGVLADERWHLDEAEQWLRQALQILEHSPIGQAQTLHHLGNIALKRKQFTDAQIWYRQSLSIQKRIGYEQGQAITLNQLGSVAETLGYLEEAEQLYQQAIMLNERTRNANGLARSYRSLGTIAWKRLQFDSAEQWYRQSLSISHDVGDKYEEALTLRQLGSISLLQSKFAEAERWYQQSLTLMELISDEYGKALVLYNLGALAEAQGKNSEAVQFYQQAERLFLHLGDREILRDVREALRRLTDNSSGE
jgi:tetratricopeptide (TPR) repeat protein